jgi:hypothetical protein
MFFINKICLYSLQRFYVPLVMVSLYNYIQKIAIAPVYQCGSIEPSLNPLSEMAGEYRTFS